MILFQNICFHRGDPMILFQRSLFFIRRDHMSFAKISLISSDRMNNLAIDNPPENRKNESKRGIYSQRR